MPVISQMKDLGGELIIFVSNTLLLYDFLISIIFLI